MECTSKIGIGSKLMFAWRRDFWSVVAVPRLISPSKTLAFCFHSSDPRCHHSASVQRGEVSSCKMGTCKERLRTSSSASLLLLAFVLHRRLYIFPSQKASEFTKASRQGSGRPQAPIRELASQSPYMTPMSCHQTVRPRLCLLHLVRTRREARPLLAWQTG